MSAYYNDNDPTDVDHPSRIAMWDSLESILEPEASPGDLIDNLVGLCRRETPSHRHNPCTPRLLAHRWLDQFLYLQVPDATTIDEIRAVIHHADSYIQEVLAFLAQHSDDAGRDDG